MMTMNVVVAHDRAMQLRNLSAACQRMQIVDVLGDDAQTPPGSLQFCDKAVSGVGLSIGINHAAAVKAIEFLWVFLKKMVADDFFRRVIVLLMIQAIDAAEIRNSTFRGCAGAGKKDDAFSVIHDGLQLL